LQPDVGIAKLSSVPRLIDSKSDKRLWILDELYDDDCPLWQIGHPNLFPKLRPDAVGSEITLLLDLVDGGYIGLYHGAWARPEAATRIGSNEVLAVLQQAHNWEEVDGRQCYFLSMEPRGLRFYRASGLGHPDD
jgi:hypothetical protein